MKERAGAVTHTSLGYVKMKGVAMLQYITWKGGSKEVKGLQDNKRDIVTITTKNTRRKRVYAHSSYESTTLWYLGIFLFPNGKSFLCDSRRRERKEKGERDRNNI